MSLSKSGADGKLVKVAGNHKSNDATILAQITPLKKRYLTTSYISSDKNTWYNIYNDGWKECGGRLIASYNGEFRSVTFPVTFSNLPTIHTSFIYGANGSANYEYISPRNFTKSGFTTCLYVDNSIGTCWEAKGY